MPTPITVGDRVLVIGVDGPNPHVLKFDKAEVGDKVIGYPLGKERDTKIFVPKLSFNIGDKVWAMPEFPMAGFDWKLDFKFDLLHLNILPELRGSLTAGNFIVEGSADGVIIVGKNTSYYLFTIYKSVDGGNTFRVVYSYNVSAMGVPYRNFKRHGTTISIGMGRHVHTSTDDGETWQLSILPDGDGIVDLIYADGIGWVALSWNPVIGQYRLLISGDAISWASAWSGTVSNNYPWIYNSNVSGELIVSGYNYWGNVGDRFQYSGGSLTRVETFYAPHWYMYNKGVWPVGSKIYMFQTNGSKLFLDSSSDGGHSWVAEGEVVFSLPIEKIWYVGGKFWTYAYGTTDYYSSDDGLTWNKQTNAETLTGTIWIGPWAPMPSGDAIMVTSNRLWIN